MPQHWRDDPRQRVWLRVGLLFLAFYFAEAVLFWGPAPRVAAPRFTPLVFWGAFGVAVVWTVTRAPRTGPAPDLWEQGQSWLLGATITSAAVGLAWVVIRRTGDVTLGHGVLLGTLAEAAFVIGALSYNVGWTAAGTCWAVGAAAMFLAPAVQDFVLGAVVGLGFVLIGTLRRSRSADETRD